MKNNSIYTVFSLLFILFVLGSSCGPETPPPIPPIVTPTSVTDIDGNKYSVKVFGSTIWMMENLRVTQYDTESPLSGETIAVATENQSVDTDKPYYIDARNFIEAPYTDNLTEGIRNSLGLLYNWSAAAGTVSNNTSAASAAQGICPNGWHLPKSNDIDSLFYYLDGIESAGLKLKSKLGWYSSEGSGTNESSMNCYPAGLAAGNFVSLTGQQTMFWSSTNQLGIISKAVVLKLFYNCEEAEKLSVNKFQANSVRCIRYLETLDN